jgi:hypothetical protein
LCWVFQDRVSQTIFPGWLQTVIFLISVSWVARITGVSHWHPLLLVLTFRRIKKWEEPAELCRIVARAAFLTCF